MTQDARPRGTNLEGLIEALAALDAWAAELGRSDPALERVLEGLARSAGAAGAFLEATFPPLPAISAGTGSLLKRPARTRRPALVTVDLRGSHDGMEDCSGTLWLDGPAADAKSIARILGLAFDRARAHARLVSSAARVAALDEAVRATAGVLSLDRVLQVIVDRVRELIGARYAALGIHDADGVIERFITSGLGRAERIRIGAPPRGLGILGLITRENRSFRLDDLATDPRRHGMPPGHPEMHSFLGVPVTVHGRTIGNLYLTEREGGFSVDDQALVETFAGHAAIAMENARLHEQVQRLAIVEERERIGKDLHDGIIQSIYAVGLSLEDVPEFMEDEPAEARRRVEHAIESLDQTIRDIRNFIFGLRPQLLDGVELVEGLAALADEFRVNTMVDVELRAGPDVDASDLDDVRTLELLSIAREALSNIARHAKATRAEITVMREADDNGLVLEIADNGKGFDPVAPRGLGHQGIRNIRGRASGIGATLAIDSTPGVGTRIILNVPCEPSPADATDGSYAPE